MAAALRMQPTPVLTQHLGSLNVKWCACGSIGSTPFGYTCVRVAIVARVTALSSILRVFRTLRTRRACRFLTLLVTLTPGAGFPGGTGAMPGDRGAGVHQGRPPELYPAAGPLRVTPS
eukprot:9370658-Pyramimonas_sp.AAC.1